MADSEQLDYPHDLLDQAAQAFAAGLYLPALVTGLTIPDLCAALNDPSGKTSRARCIQWLRSYSDYKDELAELIYGFRCSLLHQGSGNPHRMTGIDRVLFTMPGGPRLHRIRMTASPDETAWMVDIGFFLDDMVAAMSNWLLARVDVAHVRINLARCVRVHRDGIRPYLYGFPTAG